MAKRGSGSGGAGNSRAGRKAGRLLDIPEREVQRMHYSEYKKRYSEYYADHYDTETKTIDVIVNPRREAFIKSLPDAYIEHVAQKRLGQDAANWKSKSDKEWLRRHYGSEAYDRYTENIEKGVKMKSTVRKEMQDLYKALGGKIEKVKK
jgi:hypothetical protein